MTVTPQQQPIHSSFGATSTAQQVLADVDLHGMQVLVTGGYSGLGLATTRALLAAGAQVWVPALRPQLATHLFAQFDSVNIGACDLSDLDLQ